MMKTVILISTTFFGAVAASAQVTELNSPTPIHIAEQTIAVPQAESVVAQFSYLELSHDVEGFHFSVTDKTNIFVDLEFPGDLHIRIGF